MEPADFAGDIVREVEPASAEIFLDQGAARMSALGPEP
jgi:hypothetical protein